MSIASILLIGAGGHARSCIDVIELHDGYQITGLVGLADEIHTQHFDYPVFATDSDLRKLAKTHQNALITVGQIHTPDKRIRLYQMATDLGFKLPVIISPTAYVSKYAKIGSGTIVMHGAIINAGVTIGNNCIINSRALIEHDATVGDHCHISTGAILNGNVQIGFGSFLGSGSVVKEGVRLDQRCVVGMGLAVRSKQAKFIRSFDNSIR
jgi:sugar O-acyltransferase (sialic acid O-acetyltransferase NeuD family)